MGRPGVPLTPNEKSRIELLRGEGWTQAETARRIGRSRDAVAAYEHGLSGLTDSGPGARRQRQGRGLKPPIPFEQLCPEAQRAWNDIGYFALRYFGLILMPFQAEEALRIVELEATDNEEYVAINQPPGTGKSTFFTLVVPAWLTVRNRAIRGLIGSASKTMAETYTARLRVAFTRQVPVKAKPADLRMGIAVDAVATLAGDFGRFKPEAEGDVWQAGAFVVAQFDDVELSEKERTWSAFGRATTFLGTRVDFVIWDDAYDPTQVRTLQAHEELFGWWDDIAETRLEPGGLFILQGQRLGPDDLYRYALDKRAPGPDDEVDLDGEFEPEMSGSKYHHIVFPAHFEDRCKGAAGHRKDAAPYPEGCLLYPRRLPWSKLRLVQENTPDKYEVVYQQNDVSLSEVLVKPLWVSGGEDLEGTYPGCWDKDRRLWELPKNLMGETLFVASVDPSPKNFWAVQAWALNRDPSGQETRYLLDLEGVKMASDQFLDWNAAEGCWTGLAEDWMRLSTARGMKIGTWIVEVNAFAKNLFEADHVRRWQARWNVDLLPHTTGRNKADEQLGVPIIRNRWKYGQVRLPGHNDARLQALKLVQEVTRWRPNVKQRDDQVMAEWFFERHASSLVAPGVEIPTLPHRPSWLRGVA